MVHEVTLTEFMEAINGDVEGAVDEVVRSYLPTIADYLEELDKGEFKCQCSGDVEVVFTPKHNVIVRIPVRLPGGYTWAFRAPITEFIEVEADGTFEARLQ